MRSETANMEIIVEPETAATPASTDDHPSLLDGTVDVSAIDDTVEPSDTAALADPVNTLNDKLSRVFHDWTIQYLDTVFSSANDQPNRAYVEMEDRAKAAGFIGAEISGTERSDFMGDLFHSVGVLAYYLDGDRTQAEYGEVARLSNAAEAVELYQVMEHAIHEPVAFPELLLPSFAHEVAEHRGIEVDWQIIPDDQIERYGSLVRLAQEDMPLSGEVETQLALDSLALTGMGADVQTIDLDTVESEARNLRELEEGLARLGLEITDDGDRILPVASLDVARVWVLAYETPDGNAIAGLFSTGLEQQDAFAVSVEGTLEEVDKATAILVDIAEHLTVPEIYTVAQGMADGTVEV